MTLKVTVVIPVFDPGSNIDRCIESLLAQSLPEQELEAIFVDDGSTDGTAARLDDLAAAHRHLHVIHQANSGWPGQPRNVGITAAQGEYIFFLDHDDALGAEALERLYVMAKRNDADIVIGKMAGHHRNVPRDLFLANRDRATLADAPLMDSLTPHKLFRRAFLDRHGLRFPEGRRRLEDHVFVLTAYFVADVISVLSDYICYYHYRREDRANAGLRQLEPVGYFGNIREVIGIIEANAEPPQFRDQLLEPYANGYLLGRLRGRGFLDQPESYRQILFAEIRGVVEGHIGPTVDDLLAPAPRIQMALVRAGRLDLLVELAEAELEITLRAYVSRITWSEEGTLDLDVEAGLRNGTGPISLERHGDGHLLPVPDNVASVVPINARMVLRPTSDTVAIFVRRRDDSAELVAPCRQHAHITSAGDDRDRVVYNMRSEIDPKTIASGRSMWPGYWDVVVRAAPFGYARETKVGAPATRTGPGFSAERDIGALSVVSYWSRRQDHLTLDVRPLGAHRSDHPWSRRLRGPLGRVRRGLRRLVEPSRR